MEAIEKRIEKRVHVSLFALLFLAALLGLSVLLEGCTDKCETTNTYVYYEPVYTKLSDIRSAVSSVAPTEINSLGRLYFKDDILFVNEPGEGIHIIDNHDPKNPINKTFINIPGNYDLAIKGNHLYADSYVDLVVIDISDLNTIKEVTRIENAFGDYNSLGFYVDQTAGVVTEWVQKDRVEVFESECNPNIQTWGGIYYSEGIAFDLVSSANFSSKAAIAPGNGSGPGLGGSLARFTINSDYLYTLDGGDVDYLDISNEALPVQKGNLYVNWDIETIFPYNDKLFLGARSGMHIVDVSTPSNPTLLSTFTHVNSCDPVVVDDKYAYVTLRSGNPTCNGFNNQLDVIDIQNLSNPVLLKSYEMTNPHGLGIDGSTLFICDGNAGLKVYDASDINTIDKNLIAKHAGINALDVIPFNNVLMLIGEDGVFQYDYSDPNNLKLLSKIKIKHED